MRGQRSHIPQLRPAPSHVNPAAETGADRAAGKEGCHVKTVKPVAELRSQHEDRPLSERQVAGQVYPLSAASSVSPK